jgi:GNAT superfamily N-acetyltransferase
MDLEQSGLVIELREAVREDLREIVRLLTDDPFGGSRECDQSPLPVAYYDALAAIAEDPNNEVLIAALAGQIVGVLQLTFIPSLTHTGSWRAQIEGVRVASEYRGQGIGTQLVNWAIELAEAKKCRLVQLTMDRRREEAGAFYERLGFTATHEGFKQEIDPENGG